MSTYSELEKVLFVCYEQARTSIIHVDENIHRGKAFEIVALNGMDSFSASNGRISRLKIFRGDDDNADEGWLRVADDVFGIKFSDYISIDQDGARHAVS
ncbi:hypothetical protein NPIL_502741 [Nephila pilipes]|uniref:Uncharacterized protein n=1 Tax=Nephila pilipes TaxID=299642 RepID=A0A8X6PZ84_NEPPI|nr:hypothetical protein NPIL_502741 [Nephila pilipes]